MDSSGIAPRSAFAALFDPPSAGAPAIIPWAIAVLATFFILLHLDTGMFGGPDATIFLTIHVCTALAVVFLVSPSKRKWHQPLNRYFLIDALCIAGSFWVAAYILFNIETWDYRNVSLDMLDYVTGIGFVLLSLEAVRRTIGWILVLVAVFFLVHASYADLFPGIFYGPPTSFDSLLVAMFVGHDGIFGVPVQIMAHYVVLFILFGQLVTTTGAGQFFTRLSFALFGHRIGGPAKAAVVSSAMMGSLSGSALGNVLTTGAFTIPLMRKSGYRPAFAAGVEAAASTGGMVMPPVMGAIAFMMAEFTGNPYVTIALAAAIPALLYFLAIFITVHLEARKLGLGGLDKSVLPNAWELLRRQGYLILPLALIIGTLIMGFSIIMVALVSLAGTFVLSFVRRNTAMTPMRIVDTIESATRATVVLSATTACAGMIIGAIFSTGLSFQISQAAVAAAGEQLWLLLAITGIMALVLGMGMTSSAVYITLVATVIPILKLADVPIVAAHMFAVYYGILSNITPPVALAAFAAAPLARAHPLMAGVEASRLGIGAFILPILFVYRPSLLLIGSPLDTAMVVVTTAIGLTAIAAAFTGYLMGLINPLQRLMLLASSLLLIVPNLTMNLVGVVLFAFVAGGQWLLERRTGGASAKAVRPQDAGGTEPVSNDEDMQVHLERLRQEDEIPGGTKDYPEANMWVAWAVVAAAALALAYLGHILVHATHPRLWALALLLTSAAGVTGLAAAVGRRPRVRG